MGNKREQIHQSLGYRGLERNPVRPEDRLSVRIRGADQFGSIKDINSTGALVEFPSTVTGLHSGQLLKDVEIVSNESIVIGSYPIAMICHVQRADDGATRTGLFFCELESDSKTTTARQERLSSQANFMPIGHFESPLVYNDIVHFKLNDISRSGARLSTSARNHKILKGQSIRDVSIFFPTLGSAAVDLQVAWIKKNSSNDTLELGVRFEKVPPNFSSLVAQYLLSFGVEQSSDLRKKLASGGFKTKASKRRVTYGIVSSAQEYNQVLELRRAAYLRAGKISPDTTAQRFADEFDQHSYILFAKHGDEIVGSMRLTFCSNDAHRFELDSSIQVPNKFPRLKTFEASRACVHQDFENSDLIHGLFEAGIELAVKTSCEWVITSCERKLLGLYQKLGFKEQGIQFELATLNKIPHLLIAAPTRIVYTSEGLSPIVWYFSHRKIAKHLENLGLAPAVQMSTRKKIIYFFTTKIIDLYKRLKH